MPAIVGLTPVATAAGGGGGFALFDITRPGLEAVELAGAMRPPAAAFAPPLRGRRCQRRRHGGRQRCRTAGIGAGKLGGRFRLFVRGRRQRQRHRRRRRTTLRLRPGFRADTAAGRDRQPGADARQCAGERRSGDARLRSRRLSDLLPRGRRPERHCRPRQRRAHSDVYAGGQLQRRRPASSTWPTSQRLPGRPRPGDGQRPAGHADRDGQWLRHCLRHPLGPDRFRGTANNAARVSGTPNPTFSVTYAGFVNGDTASSLGGTLVITTTATTSSPAGTYALNAKTVLDNQAVDSLFGGSGMDLFFQYPDDSLLNTRCNETIIKLKCPGK